MGKIESLKLLIIRSSKQKKLFKINIEIDN